MVGTGVDVSVTALNGFFVGVGEDVTVADAVAVVMAVSGIVADSCVTGAWGKNNNDNKKRITDTMRDFDICMESYSIDRMPSGQTHK